MRWFFIVLGLLFSTAGVWMGGDERAVCRASVAEPVSTAPPAADCRIQIRRWWGVQVYRDYDVRGVEEFRVVVDRQRASDPNDPPEITTSLELVTHDGSRYKIAGGQPEVEAAALNGHRWLASGMPGEYRFVSDAFGRGIMAILIGAGCVLGGALGLVIAKAKRKAAP
jgi:hypothetical protein